MDYEFGASSWTKALNIWEKNFQKKIKEKNDWQIDKDLCQKTYEADHGTSVTLNNHAYQ